MKKKQITAGGIEPVGKSPEYEINWSKVTHWTDLKRLLMNMDMQVTGDPEDMPEIRHLLKKVE